MVRTIGPASASSSSSSSCRRRPRCRPRPRHRCLDLEVGVERRVDLDGLFEVADLRCALELECRRRARPARRRAGLHRRPWEPPWRRSSALARLSHGGLPPSRQPPSGPRHGGHGGVRDSSPRRRTGRCGLRSLRLPPRPSRYGALSGDEDGRPSSPMCSVLAAPVAARGSTRSWRVEPPWRPPPAGTRAIVTVRVTGHRPRVRPSCGVAPDGRADRGCGPPTSDDRARRPVCGRMVR